MFLSLNVHWAARRRFAGVWDWALYLYNRVLRRLPRMPMMGRGVVKSIRLSQQRDPFSFRLGATDLLVLEEMFQTGEYAFVQPCLQKAARIVDLGSNVGFSLRYWNNLFPEAHILAVEPDPKNCRLCMQNVQAGRFPHLVRLVQACVGSHRRKVKLGGSDEWAYQMVDGVPASDATIDVLTMDDLLDAHFKGQSIDLLKCDIEGAESELFKNCGSWIKRIGTMVVELHPPYSVSEFQADLKNSGATFSIVREFSEKECPVLLLQSSLYRPPV